MARWMAAAVCVVAVALVGVSAFVGAGPASNAENQDLPACCAGGSTPAKEARKEDPHVAMITGVDAALAAIATAKESKEPAKMLAALDTAQVQLASLKSHMTQCMQKDPHAADANTGDQAQCSTCTMPKSPEPAGN